MSCTWQLSNQENDSWTPLWNAQINPVQPAYFSEEMTTDGLAVVCGGSQYAGQLLKNTAPLLNPNNKFIATYGIKFGADLLAAGQVIEIDRKFTDVNGYTYDGSFQLLPGRAWMTQVNNPWVDNGAQAALSVDVWNTVTVSYVLDYVNHTISVNGSPLIAAKKIGWAVNEVVTQLQLCTSKSGFYMCKFKNIGLIAE